MFLAQVALQESMDLIDTTQHDQNDIFFVDRLARVKVWS